MGAIYKFGSDLQKKRYLESLAKGDLVGAFGLTEPLYGSDPGGMITEVKDMGDHFLMNGEKHWITFTGFTKKPVKKDTDEEIWNIYEDRFKKLTIEREESD